MENFNKGLILGCTLVLSLLVPGAACSQPKTAVTPPFLPPEYYACYEVNPDELVDIYYTSYGNIELAESLYNDKIYVLKNISVIDRMFKYIDEGFIWVDRIQCYMINPGEILKYSLGDKIDVVGLNKGPTYKEQGIMFIDCILIPAGTVALPADEDAGSIAIGY